MPCKSGWPSGVRGGVQLFVDADASCPAAGTGASDKTAITAATVIIMKPKNRFLT
jgi:hypothetical protein